MRWQSNGASNSKKEVLVPAGTYVGKIQFADHHEKYYKVRVKMDTDDGQRVRFSIGKFKAKAALDAVGRDGDGTQLEGEWLVGKRVKVELDQWSPPDKPDEVYNTLKGIRAAPQEVSGEKPIRDDSIPF